MSVHAVQRIQDSVHGLIEFEGVQGLVVDVLRAPELQRLRRVRQLGLAHFVFPGAEHSRLTHCLGAAHLAVRFGQQVAQQARRFFIPALVPDENAIADLALAALCHDLGHGPMSHAWEREIVGENFKLDTWAPALGLDPADPLLQGRKWHEVVGHGLLAWEEGILHQLFESHDVGTANRIRQLLGGRYYMNYLPRLLNSDVDVDRADFVMRDTLYTGVAYGRFDLNWLVSTCTLGTTDDDGRKWVIGFDSRKAVRVIEQFLIARRALYETVYHHKTVRCIEGMVALLLRRLKDIIATGATPAVTEVSQPVVRMMQGEALSPPELLRLDDFSLSVLVDAVANGVARDDTSRDLAQRILARDLFKLVPVGSDQVADFLAKPEKREALYGAIKPYVPGPSQYYMIVDRTRFDMFSRSWDETVLLVGEDGRAHPASEHPELRGYAQSQPMKWRLFTVPQAVPAVRAIVLDG
jgi:uncharacterized protein